MNRKLLFLTTAIISGFAFSSGVSKAWAGFEWNPPAAKPAATSPQNNAASADSSGGPLTPMPGDTMASAKVEPVSASDIMDNGPPVAPVTQTNMPGMKSLGVSGSTENDMMLPVPGETASANAGTVEGFGKDIPLATALHQVVPGNYTIAYASGVDQGKPVSWKGGKPWNIVVSDMLRAKKLHAEMSGNTITVAKGAGSDLDLSVAPVMANSNTPMVDDGPAPTRMINGGGRPVIDMALQKHWTAPAGQSLRQTLSDWSGQANVELAWQNMNDMPLKSAFSYDGTYDQAVDALLSLYDNGANEPHGKLYPNLPEGPSVLVIGSN